MNIPSRPADRRDNADFLREIAALQEEVRRLQDMAGLQREANQHLVLATVDAQTMRDVADALNQRQVEFVAMLAHELRNPLAPIGNGAQLLALLVVDVPEVQEISEIISRQVDHMTSLLDDLLDVSRVTQGAFTIASEPLDLSRIVNEAIEQARPMMGRKAHHLAVKLPPEEVWVRGDGTRLVQILSNLLTNAAKYTPERGHIALTVDARADQIFITVCDDGIGIAPELLPHVFDLFTQAERSLDRTDGGLGLGLAVVRNLVERHGGAVEAESAGYRRGSVFRVILPRLHVIEDGLPADQSFDLYPNAQPMRMMVVDDNIDAARTAALLLGRHGHHVVVAHDAQLALERAAVDKPQVFLIDIGMPGMDGYELARRLRTLPATRTSTLIAVTGYGQHRDREQSRAAGFDYHLVKPIDGPHLMKLLARIDAHG